MPECAFQILTVISSFVFVSEYCTVIFCKSELSNDTVGLWKLHPSPTASLPSWSSRQLVTNPSCCSACVFHVEVRPHHAVPHSCTRRTCWRGSRSSWPSWCTDVYTRWLCWRISPVVRRWDPSASLVELLYYLLPGCGTLMQNVTSAPLLTVFRKRLKSHLFSRSIP